MPYSLLSAWQLAAGALTPAPTDITPLALSGFGALALLLISLAISAFNGLRKDSKEVITRLDAVKDAAGVQSATIGRLEERFNGLDNRVEDLHKRRNIEHERLLVVAADAIVELRAERRNGEDRRHA